MRSSLRAALLAAALTAAVLSATALARPGRHAGFQPGDHRACARQFDATIQRYITTTQTRDLRGFASVLDRDVVVILRPGTVFYGKRATLDFIRDFFADPNWTQSFRVITRTVKDCRTAFVLFDSVYSEAGSDPLPLVIGVSFTRRDGRWLAVHNQDSQGPAHPPNPPAAG